MACVDLLSIDPGLDRVAAAHWRVEVDARARADPAQRWLVADNLAKLQCLVAVLQTQTHPTTPIPARLRSVAEWCAMQVRGLDIHLVYVERPAIGGLYRGRQDEGGTVKGRSAETLLWSHWACGAIVSWCEQAGATVHLVRPDVAKPTRMANLRTLLDAARVRPSYRNGDALDAIATGLTANWDLSQQLRYLQGIGATGV
jgi:hypothetical protein